MRWRFGRRRPDHVVRACRDCRHFENGPDAIERTFPNLSAMSSGFASVRSDDGICRLRGLYLSGRAACGDHERHDAVA